MNPNGAKKAIYLLRQISDRIFVNSRKFPFYRTPLRGPIIVLFCVATDFETQGINL